MLQGYILGTFCRVSPKVYSDWRPLVTEGTIMEVVLGCPDLEEICIKGMVGSIRTPVVSSLHKELSDWYTSRSCIG